MAYEPTEWKSKDVITSAKLNKIENALAGGVKVFVVNVVEDTTSNPPVPTLDHTYREINDMLGTGIVFVKSTYQDSNPPEYMIGTIVGCASDNTGYNVAAYVGNAMNFHADTLDDYPRMSGGK